MTEQAWRREQDERDRQFDIQEERDREDIILGIAEPVAFRLDEWRAAQRAAFTTRKEAA